MSADTRNLLSFALSAALYLTAAGAPAGPSEKAGAAQSGSSIKSSSESAGASSVTKSAAGDISEGQEKVDRLFSLVEQLRTHSPFTKAKIEEITGRSLNTEHIGYYASDDVEGDIINHVNAPHGFDGSIGMVELVLNAEPPISPATVEKKLGKHRSINRHPDIHELSNKKPVLYSFKHRGTTITCEFEDASPAVLRAISIY